MVYRLYVEKKPGFDHEAHGLLEELRSFLGIKGLTGLRVLNRYDVENLDEEIYRRAVSGVFSEPQLDDVYEELPEGADFVLAAEYLPGQFDQRADSAAQCIQLMAQCERPTVRTATVYMMNGELSEEDIAKIKGNLINPVERREASLEKVDSLKVEYELPESVPTIVGFKDMDDPTLFGLI